MNGGSGDESGSDLDSSKRPLTGFFRRLRPHRNGDSVRETLEELIEEHEEAELVIGEEERTLLSNILNLRDRTVEDVMVPRADIVSVDVESGIDAAIKLMTEEGHSRIPLHRQTLDNVAGMLHIKDMLAVHAKGDDGKTVSFDDIIRPILFVAPSMRVLELLLEMRTTRIHMALVVDEYGGTDGLVTIEDLVEEIVGEIEDEHDQSEEPKLTKRADGGFDADARVFLEDFEAATGVAFSAEEHEEIDTLGGLVFSLAGRVPGRGEIIRHDSGLEFEICDADPRRVRKMRINLPGTVGGSETTEAKE